MSTGRHSKTRGFLITDCRHNQEEQKERERVMQQAMAPQKERIRQSVMQEVERLTQKTGIHRME
jgi:hypothetical protein